MTLFTSMGPNVSVLILLLSVTACQLTAAPWYKNAIIYQLYPRSFQDSDGDGVGDLNGILERIGYIDDLGVNAIWLNPIYPSPNKDFGYDITDFKGIDPLFGTLNDFKKLVYTMHLAGIKVIMDFVPNHSSNEHPWFVKSVNGTKGYENYYVWYEGRKTGPGKYEVLNNWTSIFGGSMWDYNDQRKKFYLHQFLAEQPDFNYREPRVVEEMKDILKFWMDLGVDGFRMDAVASLVESLTLQDEPFIGPDPNNYGEYKHTMTYNQEETFDVLRKFMGAVNQYTAEHNTSEKIVMLECYDRNYQLAQKYYGTKDNPVSTFPMNMWAIMFMNQGSNATEWSEIINRWLEKGMPNGNWATANWVLGNHDQIRLASRFSPEHVDVLNMLQLSLKGVAVVYNGDELGLLNGIVRRDQTVDPQGKRASADEYEMKNRDPSRCPMPWTGGTNGNFTTGTPWLPMAPDSWYNNVEAQTANNRSHLNIFKVMARLKRTPTMSDGDIKVTTIEDSLVVYRTLIDNPTLVTVINFGYQETTVNLLSDRPSLPARLQLIVGSGNSIHNIPNEGKLYLDSTKIKLPPISAVVLSSSSIDSPWDFGSTSSMGPVPKY